MKVIKRNKELEDFNLEKVTKAIFHALKEIRLDSTQEEAEAIATRVYESLVNSRTYQVSVETIQDLVELELMKIYPSVAKEYILYREARAKKWQEGWKLEGLQKDIYESKYRYKGESFLEFLERVAPGNRAIQKAILEKKFIPAGRILAGRRTGRKNSYSNCFYPGTKVLTKSGYKPIEQIQKGEYVLTGDGTYQKVNETMVSDFNGELIVFDKSYTNNIIKTTPNHKFFTQEGWKTAEEIYIHNNKGKEKQYYGFLAKPSYPLIERTYDIKTLLEEKDRQYVIEGNFINTITPFEAIRGKTTYNSYSKGSKMFAQVKMNEDILYLLGRYLGDGSLTVSTATTHNNVSIFQLVFNAKTEKKDYIKCKKIIEENFGVTTTDNSNKNQNTLVLKVNNEPFCLLIDSLVGRGENKHFPTDYKNNLSVLLGLLDADGYLVKSGAIRLVLKNKSLFKEALSSLQNNGFNIWNAKEIQHGEGKKYSGWHLQISTRLSYRLIKLMTKEYEDNRHIVEEEEEKYCLLGKPIKEKYVGPVYNLSVENNHEYYVEGVLVHNCYVLPSPQDNLESIFNTAKEMARTYSYGGGVGLDISNLRPKGATVHNAAETTSGPISFMDLYSLTTEIIGMKGRRGALMIMMSSRHPDIYEFIKLKENLDKVLTANISVAVDNELIEAAKKNKDYLLVFEGKHEAIKKKVSARHMLMSIAAAAWDNAEPGVLFWDRIQDYHLMSRVPDFEIVAPNPCGEQPLPAYGACSLASINLSEFILDPFTSYARVNKDGLAQMVKEAVVYMNEVLDEGRPLHPLEQQKETARLYRQIGLGTMGWGDALIKLGIRYGSEESLEIIDEISELIKINALDQSSELAKIDGPFPAYSEHIFESPFFKGLPIWLQDKIKVTGLRNSQLLTLAPTGSIGTLLNISTGLEPLFEISYIRRTISINKGQETEYRVFSKVIEELMETKGIKKEEDLPDYVVTAHDLGVEERIAVQAAMQKHIDSAISSTMNMDESASVADVYNAIILAHEQGLKGITFFRNNSRRMGILSTEKKEVPKELCPDCGGKLIQQGGCSECLDCGYSACSV